jgi:hypothetical protein
VIYLRRDGAVEERPIDPDPLLRSTRRRSMARVEEIVDEAPVGDERRRPGTVRRAPVALPANRAVISR